ncbi:hypothetical protein NDU88_007140 [Pleurodeles waltl]|uniref:Uncharacterized protein n=1 Tax=Pleurodeles waltl TaxID=8319 RepID=A0AAV7QJT1_PLEWA|nr:hypothetical protein NDU88_007140 [Pleurodeles waltl]
MAQNATWRHPQAASTTRAPPSPPPGPPTAAVSQRGHTFTAQDQKCTKKYAKKYLRRTPGPIRPAITTSRPAQQGPITGGLRQARTSPEPRALALPCTGGPTATNSGGGLLTPKATLPRPTRARQFGRLSGGGIGPAVPGAPPAARPRQAVGRRRRSSPGGLCPTKPPRAPPQRHSPRTPLQRGTPGHPQQHEAARAGRVRLSSRVRHQPGPPSQSGQKARSQPGPQRLWVHQPQAKVSQPEGSAIHATPSGEMLKEARVRRSLTQ